MESASDGFISKIIMHEGGVATTVGLAYCGIHPAPMGLGWVKPINWSVWLPDGWDGGKQKLRYGCSDNERKIAPNDEDTQDTALLRLVLRGVECADGLFSLSGIRFGAWEIGRPEAVTFQDVDYHAELAAQFIPEHVSEPALFLRRQETRA